MSVVNVHLIFLVNHTKSHRTFLSSKNIWQKSHVLLIIYKLIILSQTVIGKSFAKPLAKVFRKTSNIPHANWNIQNIYLWTSLAVFYPSHTEVCQIGIAFRKTSINVYCLCLYRCQRRAVDWRTMIHSIRNLSTTWRVRNMLTNS